MTADLAVVGAGPAGAAAAVTARRAGAGVVLVDPGPGGRPDVGEVAAPGTDRLVAEVFGAGAFDPDRHRACPGTVSVWGGPDPAATEHLANPQGTAWTLDRLAFDASLLDRARALGADLVTGRVVAVRGAPGAWRLTVSRPGGARESVAARVLVDASGRGARAARGRRAGQHTADHLVALVTLWEAAQGERSAALHLEAVESGWWYGVGRPDGRLAVVHLTDTDLVPRDPRGRRELAAGARHLGLLGPLLRGARPSPGVAPRLVQARTSWLEPAAGPGWLAAGDAALSLDPLSGRGLISALLTGRSAGATGARLAADPGPGVLGPHRGLLRGLVADGLARRTEAYLGEPRWPDAPFWGRRRTPVGV